MGWLIALGILVLLAITPVGVHFRYNSQGILLQIVVGFARITLLPKKKKAEKQSTEDNKENTAKSAADNASQPPAHKADPARQPKKMDENAEKAKEKGGGISDFLPLLQVAFDFLGAFRRKLRVDRLELKLIMAGGDPCNLAVNYGKAWAAVGNLMPQLERLFVIRKRNVEVECDFTSNQTLVIARLQLTITIGRIVNIAVRYGIRAAREYFKIINKRKGGAVL